MAFESSRPAVKKSFMRTAIGHVCFLKRAWFPIRLFEEIRVFQACASSHLSVEEITVFQACTCGN